MDRAFYECRKSAELIAKDDTELNKDTALVLGMLHDIGRNYGITSMRHGVNEFTIEKWKSTFEIKEYFQERIGKSIYKVLPGVVENTFDF